MTKAVPENRLHSVLNKLDIQTLTLSLQGSENYIVLVTHACFADRVFLKHDSDPNTRQLVSKLSSWKRVGNDNYVTSEVKVEAGNVTIAMLESADAAGDVSATVGGFFFGMGPQKAYAASLGLRSNDGVQVPEIAFACSLRQSFASVFALTMEYRYTHEILFHICHLRLSGSNKF